MVDYLLYKCDFYYTYSHSSTMDLKKTLLNVLVVTTVLVATTEGNCMETCQNICEKSNNPLATSYSRPGKKGPKGEPGPRGEQGPMGESCICPDVEALKSRLSALEQESTTAKLKLARLEQSIPNKLKEQLLIMNEKLTQVEHKQELLPFPVGGSWTAIQRRTNGSVDFYKRWQEYVDGFGDPRDEFWLGLEKIHQLTTTYNMTLRVDLEDRDHNRAYAEYSTFKVASSSDNYRLIIGGYLGTAGDSFTTGSQNINNMKFTTHDRDNDGRRGNCAIKYRGGWWYQGCHSANINGDYSVSYGPKGIVWYYWHKNWVGLKSTQMSIKRK